MNEVDYPSQNSRRDDGPFDRVPQSRECSESGEAGRVPEDDDCAIVTAQSRISEHQRDIGKGAVRSFQLDDDLLRKIKDAVMVHRQVKMTEDDFDQQIARDLKAEFKQTRRKIALLKQDVAQAESGEASKSSEQLGKMQAEIQALAQQEAELASERDQANKDLREYYKESRHELYDFFESIEEFAVRHCLVNEVSGDADAGASGEDEDRTNSDTNTADPASRTEHSDMGDASGQASTKGSKVWEGGRLRTDDKTRGDWMYSLNMWRRELREAERVLELRHGRFDKEDWDRKQREAAGELTEGAETLDLQHVEECRQMTRRVVQAEVGYECVKRKALAAGYQDPCSDLESGFVDDVDDGYRLSEETEMERSADIERTLAWLVHVPEEPAPEQREGVLGDPWSSQEVEIWESASMVAEGPYRRRIDQWMATTAALRVADVTDRGDDEGPEHTWCRAPDTYHL